MGTWRRPFTRRGSGTVRQAELREDPPLLLFRYTDYRPDEALKLWTETAFAPRDVGTPSGLPGDPARSRGGPRSPAPHGRRRHPGAPEPQSLERTLSQSTCVQLREFRT